MKYTAFIRRKGQSITARLIVRRVKDLNREATQGQDELFPVWRYHAVFTDSPFGALQAEAQHRGHWWSRYSPTGPTAPSLIFHPAHFRPTPPGSPAPPSATTCCAPPDP